MEIPKIYNFYFEHKYKFITKKIGGGISHYLFFNYDYVTDYKNIWGYSKIKRFNKFFLSCFISGI